jgi:AbiJ N-terminal domain 4
MKFSERYGYKKVTDALQKESMDSQLRWCLWKCLWDSYLQPPLHEDPDTRRIDKENVMIFMHQIVDLPHYDIESYGKFCGALKDVFIFSKWFEVYDFIERVVDLEKSTQHPEVPVRLTGDALQRFKDACNRCLERHLSAWRFVGDHVAPITSEEEIAAIAQALEAPDKFASVRHHIGTALDHLADRNSPDYRNSIKESISAVEGCCQILTGKGQFSIALKVLEEKGVIRHGALKSAFGSLYGYTSDADGIRHALMDEPNLTQADAKFMLVTCSAFVNYIIERGVA